MKRRVEFTVDGECVVGDLYLPAGEGPHPGVVVAGPMTSVKEQVTGVYACAMAVRGIAGLCLDHRHYGESDGEPRQLEYHQQKVADLRAAIAWMADDHFIDEEQLGFLGVCLGCGYASHAAVDDPHSKALALIAGYYRDPAEIRARDPEGFDAKVARGRAARERYEADGVCETIPAAGLEGDAAMTLQDTFDYYATPRAGVPNYRNEFAIMSREHFLPFDVQSVAPRLGKPVAMIHSERALSPAWARRFHEALPGPKSLTWLESKNQVDFYDQPELVMPAADLAAEHFRTQLGRA